MKLSLLLLLSASILMGQNQDPFKVEVAPIPESDEAVYDFDDVHKWDDVIVKGIGKAEERIITWGATNVASHRVACS